VVEKHKEKSKNEKKEKEMKEKLEAMMSNDEKYNLVLKYAHKLYEAESFNNLRKLIGNSQAKLIQDVMENKGIIYF
jgi:hypothetical protein